MSARTPTAEQAVLLRETAYYRAFGARWEVVAFHLEMPVGELSLLLHRFRDEYRKLTRWKRDELARDRLAAERLGVRRAFRNADTKAKRIRAASRLAMLPYHRERARQKRMNEWVRRRTKRLLTEV